MKAYDYVSSTEMDYWFGMTMEFDFWMPENGEIDVDEPMIFSFSGDDDVWVFIDGKLALDLGGTHGIASGSINFADGTIKQYLNWKGTTETATADTTNSKGEVVKATSFPTTLEARGITLDPTEKHTLKFFYLERGEGTSNCSMSFNMPVIPVDLTVEKNVDNLVEQAADDEYTFTLTKTTAANADEAVVADAEYDVINVQDNTTVLENRWTDTNGKFTLKAGQKAVFKLDTANAGETTDRYYVTEDASGTVLSTSNSVNGIVSETANKTSALFINPAAATNVVFTNQLNLGSLLIEKDVQGEKTEADFAAESFTFDIKDANLNTVATVKLPTADGAWSTTVENLLFGNYTVHEQNGEISGLLLDTKVIYPGEGANNVEVANGTTPEVLIKNTYAQDLSLIKTGVSVQKQWIDSDNKDKIRPESVTVELYADDVATGQTVTLSEENGWVGMFIALDKYKDSTLIEYTVKETPIPEGYTTAVEGDAENGFIVKNTHIVSSDDYPPTVYTVKKVWEDNNNEAGLRPESITVKVLKNGSEETVVLSEANNWTYTWSGYGTYKVVEINTPEDYTSSINLTGNTFTVTNKYVPEDTPIVTPDVPDVPTGDKEAEDPTVDLGDDGVPTDYMEVDDADVPKTDDNSMLPLWLTIAALSALALVATTIAERKCRE